MATQAEDEPFFVEALFPFTGTDASSLSFMRGDVIQVLSRLPSGWWDGVLDEERGWFPSNYVRPISEAEAEEAFARREAERLLEEERMIAHAQREREREQQQQHLAHHQVAQQQQQQQQQQQRADQYTRQQHAAYWDDRATPAQDYWIPEVADNGQVTYLISTIIHR
jgi:son of sevenless-like protein